MTWYDFKDIPWIQDKNEQYILVLHNNIPKVVVLIKINLEWYMQEATGKRYYLEHHPYSKWTHVKLP